MTTHKFIWKIPELSNTHKELICYGYVRQNCNQYIIAPIIQLFECYYSTQSFCINDIKNAKPLQIFQTSIFSINNIDFYLELHPNGCNQNNAESVILFLCLAMHPSNITKVSTQLKLSLLETNTCAEKQYEFRNNKFYIGWNHRKLSLKDIQNLDQFTFELELRILTIEGTTTTQLFPDENDSKQLELVKSIKSATFSYQCCFDSEFEKEQILNAAIEDYVDGPLMYIGPFKCCFRFCPFYKNKTTTWFGIVFFYWPPHFSRALIKFTLSFVELNVSYTAYKTFDEKQTWFGCIGNSSEQELAQMTQYTLKAEASIIKILDNQDNIADYDNKSDTELGEYDSLPTVAYEWKITDGKMLRNIQNAVNVSGFVSPIFEMYGLKWYCELWPNGSRETRAGAVNVFVNMVTFESVSMEVIALVNIFWVECDDRYSNNDSFNATLMTDGATNWKLKSKDLINLKSITFELEISILDIIIDSKVVTENYIKSHERNELKFIDVCAKVFEWKINGMVLNEMKSAENGMDFDSEIFNMFGMKWGLMFYPNGRGDNVEDAMSIDLGFGVTLPSDSLVVTVRFTFEIVETGTKYVGCAVFHKSNKDAFWGSDRISVETFKKLEEFTIVLCLELIDVYDKQENVTHMFDGSKCDAHKD